MRILIKYKRYLRYTIGAIAVAVCGILYLVSEKSDYNNADDIVNIQESTIEGIENNSEVSVSEDILKQSTKIYVYICGSVNSPGVYICETDSRIYELLEMAGGYSEDADDTYLNLVDIVKDGQKIYVPNRNESYLNEVDSLISVTTDVGNNGLVNLNKATKEQLMTLPGIGESRAEDIIAYRTTNGVFISKEDIMKISGIKEAAYNKIKDLITV